MTTTQAGPSPSDPHSYRSNLFSQIGDRNPFEVLARTAITGAATPACPPSPPGFGFNEMTVPRPGPCVALLGISGSRVVTMGGAGVEVVTTPANSPP